MPLLSSSLLVLWVVMALAGYWFGFRSPAEGVLRTLFQGTFFVCLFILVPVTLSVLRSGTRPDVRLQATGIVPHPALGEMLIEPTPRDGTIQWIYVAEAPAREILEFYRWQSNRKGWAVGSDRTVQLVLARDGETLTISADDAAKGSVVNFLLQQSRVR
jgi:hypothetical protein